MPNNRLEDMCQKLTAMFYLENRDGWKNFRANNNGNLKKGLTVMCRELALMSHFAMNSLGVMLYTLRKLLVK